MIEKLLYITQVMPAPTGSGLAMRAYEVLKALSSRYSVYLLIIGRSLRSRGIASDLSMCRQIHYVPAAPLMDRDLLFRLLLYKMRPSAFVNHFSQPLEWSFVSQKRIQEVSRAFGGQHFDVLHVFRLYSAPFGEPFFTRSNFQQLDLDDIESETRDSISRLYSVNEEPGKSRLNTREAQLYAKMEQTTLQKWKRLFVCSVEDRNKLVELCRHPDIQVLPNVVSVRASVTPKQPDDIFRFLFVGSFYYYPNEDAILYFCEQVLPVLRKMSDCRFAICVAGVGLSATLRRRLNQVPEIEIAGFVSDLEKVYKRANVAIVPVRAGGGTRIKVIEAFSFQVPVVSTATGIYGIEARDEEHCLVGDAPEKFAQQCARMIREPELRMRLAKNAFELIENHHSPQALLNRCANL